MVMQLRPSSRCHSQVGTTEVIIVRAPSGPVDLRCGGQPMLEGSSLPSTEAAIVAGYDDVALLGKRYTGLAGQLEVLVIKSGAGALSVGDELLMVKDAKPLPASD